MLYYLIYQLNDCVMVKLFKFFISLSLVNDMNKIETKFLIEHYSCWEFQNFQSIVFAINCLEGKLAYYTLQR